MRGSLAGLILAGLSTHSLAASSPLPIPVRPMKLTREITRPLSDGRAIIVRRTWQVEFANSGRGFEVDGVQTAVSVEAPEALGALARIEEQRDTNSMFPVLLANDGSIIGAGPADDAMAISQAVEIAQSMIQRSAQSETVKQSALHHLASLQAAGATLIESLPPDLFFPKGGLQRSVRQISLPGGGSGEIELTYEASAADGVPWLANSTRSVITRIGSSQRISRENWRLEGA